MKVKTHIVYIVMLAVLLIRPVCGYGQNYVEDMNKITEKFKKGDISYHVKYCFYPYDSLKKITDSMSVYCCVSGEDYYTRINSSGKIMEYYRNSKYYFIVDYPESAIAVKKSSEVKQQAWDISKMDSIIHAPGVKVSYKSPGSGEGEYDITTKEGAWNRFRLVFSKSSYTIEKMYMYSSSKGKMYGADYNKPVIAMYYSGYSEKQVDKNIFNESKFFHEAKDGLALNDTYKKYKMLDYVYKLSKRS